MHEKFDTDSEKFDIILPYSLIVYYQLPTIGGAN